MGAKQSTVLITVEAAGRLLHRGEHVCLGEETHVAPEDNVFIGQLLVRAGMIMEDQTGEFISRLPADERIVAARIELLMKTGGQLVALAAAAAAILSDRSSSTGL